MAGREDRMQSRMRGAGRDIEDVSFGFILPPADEVTETLPDAPVPPQADPSPLPPAIQVPVQQPTITVTANGTTSGREPGAREGRMQSRMRGAGREIADESFGFDLPQAEPSPETSPKRRKLNGNNNYNNNNTRRSASSSSSSSSPRQPSSGSRSSARLRNVLGTQTNNPPSAGQSLNVPTRGNNPLNSSATKALSQLSLLGNSTEETPGATAALAALSMGDELAGETEMRDTISPESARTRRRRLAGQVDGRRGASNEDDMEVDLPSATRAAAAAAQRSSPATEEEVVGESPANAPGSGRRQRVRQALDNATSQSARLQKIVQEHERLSGLGGVVEPTTSSPLASKTKRVVRGRPPRAAQQQQQQQRKLPSAETTISRATRAATRESFSPEATDLSAVLSSDPAPLPQIDSTPAAAAAAAAAAEGEIPQSSSPTTRSQGARRIASAGSVRGSSSRSRSTRNASSPLGNGMGVGSDGPVAGSSPTLEVNKARVAQQATTVVEKAGPRGRRRRGVVPDSPEHAAPAVTSALVMEGEEVEEGEEAEQISAKEAARRLGRNKRGQTEAESQPEVETESPDRGSPELNSEPPSARPQKRKRDAMKASPAKQAQPKPPRRKQQPPVAEEEAQEGEKEAAAAARSKQKKATKKTATGKRRRNSSTAAAGDGDAENGNDVIPIVVQRYTKPSRRRSQQQQQQQLQQEDHDETNAQAIDILMQEEIPYADRTGVNAIDVLTQMCEEVIDNTLSKLQDAAQEAPNANVRKEFRTKLRALEAFQEELRTRLLEHTIALDSLHSLKKRVRAAQKEKLQLRGEILRIRAERQEVALKMDAVRIRHEEESQRTLHQLELSSLMHDIELAVENGKAADDGSETAAVQAGARMANLEVSVGRVAEQVYGSSSSFVADSSGGYGGGGGIGGNLQQIREFNAMLERAAAVLEGRA